MEIKVGTRVWIEGEFSEITSGKAYRIEDVDYKCVLVINDSGKQIKIPLNCIDSRPSLRDERFNFFEVVPNEKERWGVRMKKDGLLHIGCRSYFPSAYLKMCKHLLKNKNSKYYCEANGLTFTGTVNGLDDRGDVIPWGDVERIVKNLKKSKIDFVNDERSITGDKNAKTHRS